jgi:hypothetical protein
MVPAYRICKPAHRAYINSLFHTGHSFILGLLVLEKNGDQLDRSREK